MSSIYPYIPEIKRYYFCKKGHNHVQQALNTVCLDPICQQQPLLCSTCVSQYHKYHKTTPLSTFLSDYQSSIKKNNIKQTKKRIGKQYEILIKNVQQFKLNIIQKLDEYIQNINEYFIFLQKQLHIREQLQRTLNITLDTKKLSKSTSCDKQLSQSITFIIKNSLFNQQNRIINISSLLKYDQTRNLALLDKIINQNLKCQIDINKQVEKLSFVKDTMRKETVRLRDRVGQFNENKILENTNIYGNSESILRINYDHKQFTQKQTLLQTLNLNTRQLFTIKSQQLNLSQTLFKISHSNQYSSINQNPLFQFHQRQKHQMLKIMDYDTSKSIIKSNITALKPQYALICPSVDYQPLKQQNWSINILNCRNFASKNTLAIGLCSQQQILRNNFQQNPTSINQNLYLITSQGYIIKNNRQQKTDFRFSTHDTIHLKYDPYYKQLILYKDNGQKLTIKINSNNQEQDQNKGSKLYACVRLTYASDQVQVLNHPNI